MSRHNKQPVGAAVNIKKPVYAMATMDGNSAEITMYGDIYESRPTDWWTDEPIEGQFIVLDEFLADLEKIAGCKEITVRMNSYGGDAGVSNTIHNRLRELARGGAALTCIVDGVAMSGGSLIMCACDTVRVNPSSLIMIHKGWSFLFGGYNADELRETATQMDAWDKMQVEIYTRKTGLPAEEVLAMMAETTYMTGREAVEKGFADELLEDAEPTSIAASADGRSIFVWGRQMHLAPGMFAPDTIPTVTTDDAASDMTNTPSAQTDTNEGGNVPMTVEELRQTNPEVVQEIEAAARAEERSRIQQIDEVASVFANDLVAEAKYGQSACSAQELSFRAAQAAAGQGRKFLADLESDSTASGAEDVPAAPAPTDEGEDEEAQTPDEKMAHARAGVKSLFAKNKKEDK